MKHRDNRGFTRSLTAEATEGDDGAGGAAADTTTGETTEPDYSFDGYSVEFIDKVAFMPITSGAPAAARPRRS
jgi:hypothetical protein